MNMQLYTRHGQALTKGQLLAMLKDPSLRLAANEAAVLVASAELDTSDACISASAFIDFAYDTVSQLVCESAAVAAAEAAGDL
jgi:hypothetical protein